MLKMLQIFYTMHVSFSSFFTLLIEVILNAAKTMDDVGQQFSSFTTHVVSDIIMPNCVWRAGR